MRLINADEIPYVEAVDGDTFKRTGRLYASKKDIDSMPTIEERKTGKWIEREVTYIDELEAKDIITAWQSCKCLVCGRYDTRPYMYYFDEPKYCSWCGAKMEENN